MAMKKELEILVAPDGTTTIEGHGFSGAECDDSLKPFETLGQVKERRHTSEYHKGSVVRKVGVGTKRN